MCEVVLTAAGGHGVGVGVGLGVLAVVTDLTAGATALTSLLAQEARALRGGAARRHHPRHVPV